MKSVKRPTEKSIDLAGLPFQPSASRTMILPLLIPAVNCWASIIRPLRGLIEPLFMRWVSVNRVLPEPPLPGSDAN
jgi:hypothetical protein